MAPGGSVKQNVVISQAIPVPCKTPGTADIVGFGASGVVMLRNEINSKEQLVVKGFGSDNRWRVEQHVRVVADTTGNGMADIVGFGGPGVYISLNKGNNTFDDPKLVKKDFGHAAGHWTVGSHLRFMADLCQKGRADIIGFGNAGVYVSLNNGDGTFGPTNLVLPEFGAKHWKIDKHLRFLADVNGNGLLDIIGFGNDNVYVAFNKGDGTFQPSKVVLKSMCYNQGWHVNVHPRFVADLTGDGKVDLIGFWEDGVYVALNKGDGTFSPAKKVIDDFNISHRWRSDQHQRSVADITGDGRADIVGFGSKGVYVAINNGDGTFQPVKRVLNQFAYADGWRVEKHLRFLADFTGNGKADIIGFGNKGVWVGYNNGNGGFDKAVEVIHDFGSESPGWSINTAVKFVANVYN